MLKSDDVEIFRLAWNMRLKYPSVEPYRIDKPEYGCTNEFIDVCNLKTLIKLIEENLHKDPDIENKFDSNKFVTPETISGIDELNRITSSIDELNHLCAYDKMSFYQKIYGHTFYVKFLRYVSGINLIEDTIFDYFPEDIIKCWFDSSQKINSIIIPLSIPTSSREFIAMDKLLYTVQKIYPNAHINWEVISNYGITYYINVNDTDIWFPDNIDDYD